MSKMQLPFKTMKVTFGLNPEDFPKRDTTGLKSLEMVFYIPNTSIRLTANLNPKTYRKTLKILEENPGNVTLAVQGTINEEWQVLKDAGLLAQIKKNKNQAIEQDIKSNIHTEKTTKEIGNFSERPIIILKKKKINPKKLPE